MIDMRRIKAVKSTVDVLVKKGSPSYMRLPFFSMKKLKNIVVVRF